jgi:FkbM family methyltransferase
MSSVITTPNGVFETDPDDAYIHGHMSQSSNVFEAHIINSIIKPIINKSTYIVDIGANIGCHAISYGNFNPNCNVWAFEPQKKLYDILQRNVERNGLGGRVQTFQYALAHANARASLASMECVFDYNYNVLNKAGIGFGAGGELTDVKTIDSLNLPGLDFMKIDVEGAEGLVIMGAAETIKKYRPVIFFEHNYQTIDPTMMNLTHVPTPFEALVKLGYTVFEYVDWENYITFFDAKSSWTHFSVSI